MKLLSNHQHDMDWWEARKGKASGSNTAAILGFLKKGEKKGGDNAERAGYKVKIVTEILTNSPVMDGYVSEAMRWGTEYEQFARAAYEVGEGIEVEETGFLLHDEIDRWGGSPDGLVGNYGGVEFKCPNSTTHIKWMLAGVVPPEHEPQMSAYMSITGRKWWDFCSFDPRLPLHLQLFTKRLLRDENRIAEIEAGVLQFLAEVDEMVAKLQGKNPLKEQLRRSVEMEDDGTMLTDADLPDSWKELMER